jgi:hypothetical protein
LGAGPGPAYREPARPEKLVEETESVEGRAVSRLPLSFAKASAVAETMADETEDGSEFTGRTQ